MKNKTEEDINKTAEALHIQWVEPPQKGNKLWRCKIINSKDGKKVQCNITRTNHHGKTFNAIVSTTGGYTAKDFTNGPGDYYRKTTKGANVHIGNNEYATQFTFKEFEEFYKVVQEVKDHLTVLSI